MGCSLEARAPFLSPQLLECAAEIPSNEKVSLTKSKILLRKVALDILPSDYFLRDKRGFGIPIASWIRGPLKELIGTTLAKEKIERHGLFSASYVGSLLHEHFEGKRDNSSKIWTLFMFQVWFEKWIAGTR